MVEIKICSKVAYCWINYEEDLMVRRFYAATWPNYLNQLLPSKMYNIAYSKQADVKACAPNPSSAEYCFFIRRRYWQHGWCVLPARFSCSFNGSGCLERWQRKLQEQKKRYMLWMMDLFISLSLSSSISPHMIMLTRNDVRKIYSWFYLSYVS